MNKLILFFNLIVSFSIFSQCYQIGDIGPAGGIVFYDQGSNANGWRYLEVCPIDSNTLSSSWGCYCFNLPTISTAMGTGQQNSNTVLGSGCSGSAFQYCANLNYGGYNDWFLPSKDELQAIRDNLTPLNLGNFTPNIQYWSSSSAPYGACGIDGGAWVLTFNTNSMISEYRSGYQGQGMVRAIRAVSSCCGSFITSQPLSQSVNINTTAQFTATSNSPGSTYQWQTDLGVGFQNLNSVSQYSGTGTSTLSISNVTMGNNNQPFRCIITTPGCVDTSNVAVLTVINNAGVNEELTSNIVIYPNPSNDKLTVSVDETIIGKEYSIFDQVGKLVSKGSLINANTTLFLNGLSNGIYTLQIEGKGRKTFVIQKQ